MVFPHVYRYAKNLLVATYQSPHVLAAQAKGLRPAPDPVRACLHTVRAPTGRAGGNLGEPGIRRIHSDRSDSATRPGVGQLAWKAALDRDLPLLVNITVLVALMTLVVNSLADLGTAGTLGARRHEIAPLQPALVLGAGGVASLAAGFLRRLPYAEQFRDSISAPPSAAFLLGTDELGRDRFARLLYGTRDFAAAGAGGRAALHVSLA